MRIQILSTAAAIMLASAVANAADRTTEDLNRRESARISAQQANNWSQAGSPSALNNDTYTNSDQVAQSSSGGGTAGGSGSSGASSGSSTTGSSGVGVAGTGGSRTGTPSDPNYRNSTRTPMDSVNPSAGPNGGYGTTPDPMNTPNTTTTTPYSTPRGSQSSVDCSLSSNRNDPACTPR